MIKLPLIGTGVSIGYIMLRYRKPAETLTKALGTRIADALPHDRYTVSISGLAISVQELGTHSRGLVCTPALGLVKGRSSDERLKAACELAAECITPFIAPNEKTHVDVKEDSVAIWWGGPLEHEGAARLRVIDRRDLHI